ncbi:MULTISPECIES: ATP-dependent helicase [Pacificibacter]|uniref:ATP-dependent helicase n=1 Tax=Pacificibacter TaxID=1042323 RepID=UPI001C09C4C8|nr:MULTISPECIES: UvrD-helicase domain-containing protein [Pacificibacter]MBU2935382.1 UvrD-helicase domain-containing protein [Pacificibacter marinus]MDO6615537.1 UvrD-helicase domain-containing protein [Pacificibacter sp. 1_MG-2023]
MSRFDEEDAFEAAVAPAGGSLTQRAMAARPMPYLDGLNPAQREAVETLDGPVLMLAGAGTGKTKALTCRIAHLLNTGRARPNEILAVTFTNKAAREMKERVGGLMGTSVAGMPWLGTFHSVCVKQLRRHAELVGLKSNYTILDTDDVVRLLKQLIKAEGIDEKRWPARQLAGVIDAWKNRALTPEKVSAADDEAFNGYGLKLYRQYQDRLKALNACDFGDLLLHMVTIFQTHPDLLEQYQRWYKYILVDEYQDTNVAQYLWLRLLGAAHKNVCCVGDDDQSIYGWRGAEVGNILRFEKDFPGAKVVRLEQNYRSTPHILAAASGVIAGNTNRLGKDLWTAEPEGELVRLIGHWDYEDEARWIGEEIEAMASGSRAKLRQFSLEDMAILVRASHQMRAFEDRFLKIGLAYRVIGGPKFYERLECRDAIAYFRVVIQPEDDLAFERIINTPKRGVGPKALLDIQTMARANGVALKEGARLALQEGMLKGKAKTAVAELVTQLDTWSSLAVQQIRYPGIDDDEAVVESVDYVPAEISHVELAERILDESGYTVMWQNDKTPEAPGRLENLKELVKGLDEHDNLNGFLENVALSVDNDSNEFDPKVTIMTLHGAKGLEFPVVFLPGWEEGLFPSQRSMDESGLSGLEEERRLAYVGITRAEELCTISFASNRPVFGQWQSQLPSRFIDEMPHEHVDVMTPQAVGSGFGTSRASTASFDDRVSEADVYNSPGWKRLQSRQHRAPAAKPITLDMKAATSFVAGERVFHVKFGYGEVILADGDTLTVEFDHAGAKTLKAQYVKPAAQADDAPF